MCLEWTETIGQIFFQLYFTKCGESEVTGQNCFAIIFFSRELDWWKKNNMAREGAKQGKSKV